MKTIAIKIDSRCGLGVAGGEAGTKTIVVKIDAGPTHCDNCEYLGSFSTGLVSELYPRCKLFKLNGPCGEYNMKRPKECLDAEKKWEKRK